MRYGYLLVIGGSFGLSFLMFQMACDVQQPREIERGRSAGSRVTAQAMDPNQRLLPPSVIVEETWLRAQLGDNRLVIIDARAPERYAAGHVEGAVNLTPKQLSSKRAGHELDMAPVSAVQAALGNAGIDNHKTVVIYDDSEYSAAARVFWVMEVHGHPAVAVLNRGFKGWEGAQGPISSEVPPPQKTRFIANIHADRFVGKYEVLKAVDDPAVVLLDSRSPEVYCGLVPMFGHSGHIKGAVNFDFRNNMTSEPNGVNIVRGAEQLATLYNAKWAGKRQIIAYSNMGMQATVSYLILRSLGLPVAVYDGSWKEWTETDIMPTETGNNLDTPNDDSRI